jgi:zinc/manganese transport system substrate-binding protein
MRPLRTFLLALAASASLQAHAALNVVACEPEWASLVKELGGDKLSVASITTALQDPHRIEARPSLIARVRGADLLVCTGMDLESGWLPLLLRQSGNTRVSPGAPGHFEAGRFVTPLDVPTRADRRDGDVHVGGNPHIQLDPRNVAEIARALGARLAEIDAANGPFYQERLSDFSARWATAVRRWEQQAQPLKGVPVVAHHKNMTYLWNWLGVREVATLQPKPGVEPSGGHLSALTTQLAQQPARMVVRAVYEDARASAWLSQQVQVPVVVLPFTVGGNEQASDLFGLFDSSIALLLGARR